ncbi:MAG: FeoB-associated Cys-rich membrane protein [Eggerthellaceae bacterium]|jgi:radical SAM protein with 4Fe4S-binding SPASM domain
MGNIIVGGLLVAALAAVIASMVRKKREGKSVLCDGCESQDCCHGQCPVSQQAVDHMQQALDGSSSEGVSRKRSA